MSFKSKSSVKLTNQELESLRNYQNISNIWFFQLREEEDGLKVIAYAENAKVIFERNQGTLFEISKRFPKNQVISIRKILNENEN